MLFDKGMHIDFKIFWKVSPMKKLVLSDKGARKKSSCTSLIVFLTLSERKAFSHDGCGIRTRTNVVTSAWLAMYVILSYRAIRSTLDSNPCGMYYLSFLFCEEGSLGMRRTSQCWSTSPNSDGFECSSDTSECTNYISDMALKTEVASNYWGKKYNSLNL